MAESKQLKIWRHFFDYHSDRHLVQLLLSQYNELSIMNIMILITDGEIELLSKKECSIVRTFKMLQKILKLTQNRMNMFQFVLILNKTALSAFLTV